MPRQVRAVVVDPTAPGKLAIEAVELRDPDRDEVTVRVTVISLNRGETRYRDGTATQDEHPPTIQKVGMQRRFKAAEPHTFFARREHSRDN